MAAPTPDNKAAPSGAHKGMSKDEQIEDLQKRLNDLHGLYLTDANIVNKLPAQALATEDNLVTVQAKQKFSFAGLRGPHRRIMLMGGFNVNEGEVVHISARCLERLSETDPTVEFETDEKKFKDQTRVVRTWDKKTGRWRDKEDTTEVKDLIARARKVGQLKVS